MREKIIEVGICFEEFINLVIDTFAVAIWSKTTQQHHNLYLKRCKE